MRSSIKKQHSWIERPAQPIMIDSFNGDMEKAVMFYSAEADRLYLANYLLDTQLKASIEEKNQLSECIIEMEKNQRNSSQEEKRRRHRRCASQIAREYYCKAPRCGKSYGSEGSLSQHMKIKHPQLVTDLDNDNEFANNNSQPQKKQTHIKKQQIKKKQQVDKKDKQVKTGEQKKNKQKSKSKQKQRQKQREQRKQKQDLNVIQQKPQQQQQQQNQDIEPQRQSPQQELQLQEHDINLYLNSAINQNQDRNIHSSELQQF